MLSGHTVFVYFRHFGTELQRKKRTVNYPNISSAIRPLPHTEDFPVPVPLQQYILDSGNEPTKNREKTPQPSTSTDADFTADLQFNEFHRITQEELNDPIRDLDLPKSNAYLPSDETLRLRCILRGKNLVIIRNAYCYELIT